MRVSRRPSLVRPRGRTEALRKSLGACIRGEMNLIHDDCDAAAGAFSRYTGFFSEAPQAALLLTNGHPS